MKRQISAVVFDLDGTLYLQAPVRRAMMRRLLRAGARDPWSTWNEWRVIREYRRAQEHVRTWAEPLAEAQLQLACERRRCRPEDAARVIERWMVEAPLDILARHLRPGIVEFLNAAAKSGIRLGVLSDYPANRKLAAMGIDRYFSTVLCAGDARNGLLKPSPKGLKLVLAELGVDPECAVYVGDRPSVDGETAHRAGVAGVILGEPHGRNGLGWVGVPDVQALYHLL